MLFLHGEANTSSWRNFHEALAADFDLHAPVLPGFGESPLPDWVRDTSDLAFHYVDVIRAVWAGLELERPVVMGCSMGGAVVLRLAADFHTELRAIIGLESAASAACTARSSPWPWPIAIQAGPALFITERTSAKSRLISPGTRISSAID